MFRWYIGISLQANHVYSEPIESSLTVKTAKFEKNGILELKGKLMLYYKWF